MKKTFKFSILYSLLIFSFFNVTVANGQQSGSAGWKAGIARLKITPEEPIWMAGYATRVYPSEGVLTDLWAKALAIEDAKGRKVVLITTDLLGIPKGLSDEVRDQIAIKYGLTKEQTILCSAHTHTGPVLLDALFGIYNLNEQQIDVVRKYSIDLEKKLIALTGDAIQSLVPA